MSNLLNERVVYNQNPYFGLGLLGSNFVLKIFVQLQACENLYNSLKQENIRKFLKKKISVSEQKVLAPILIP